MRLSPDEIIFWQYGFIKLNATIVFTWGLMLLLVIGSKCITRKLSTDMKRSRWQNLLEVIVGAINDQVKDVLGADFKNKMPFIATLFLFILVSN
ncbi:MAG: F0F1 ATP synthase subunit A, partial [Anaerolineales bacterium]